MGKKNSLDEGFILRLIIASLNDVASASTYPNVELVRDTREIVRRYRFEGLSFLTRTMSSLGKAIDKALSIATPLRCPGFKLKRNTQIPQFLGCLIERVFDVDGRERSDASPEALKQLRQVCTLLHKLGVPTTEKQNDETITKFKDTDRNLPLPDSSPILGGESSLDRDRNVRLGGAWGDIRSVCLAHTTVDPKVQYLGRRCVLAGIRLDRVQSWAGWSLTRLLQPSLFRSAYAESVIRHAKRLVARVVGTIDPRGVFNTPRHGPGAVSGGERGAEKMDFTVIYSELDRVFPYGEYFVFNSTHHADLLQESTPFSHQKTGTAKVVLVPKDSRGPRLISAEPKEYQWIQQGLRRVLEKAISESKFSSGMVNFVDQTINRDLALAASKGAPWVTLDMKDASDRVSCALVSALFPEPWLTCLMASRSTHTRLPSGEVFEMRKFAPMGSSLCFPVESLVFWALSVAAILHKHPELTAFQAARRVYVYGDDLIVRIEDHDTVLHTLPLYGLMFNEAKCCTAGSFRESCGCDAFKGVDVTPLRIKSVWDRRIGMSAVAYVELHNLACVRGLYNLADCIYDEVSQYYRFPHSESADVGYVCWVDDRKTAVQRKLLNKRFKYRFGSPRGRNDYQRHEIRCWTVCSRPNKATVPGWSEMLRVASYRPPSAPVGPEKLVTRLAPDGIHCENRGLTPTKQNFVSFVPEGPLVTAYQYALRDQAFLKIRWCEV